MASQKKTAAAKADIDKAGKMTLEDVVKEVGATSVASQRAFGDITARMTERLQELNATTEAVALAKAELKELRDLDVEAVSLQDLRDQHAGEEDAHARKVVERDEQWRRDHEGHAYETAKAQREEKDRFSQEMLLRRREEDRRAADAKAAQDAREAALKGREDALAAVQKAMADELAKVKGDADRGKHEAIGAITRDMKHEAALKEKDAANKEALLGAQILVHVETIKQLNAQNSEFQRQLTASHTREAEVTKQALESVSGRQSLAAVQHAMETQGSGSSKR